MTNALHSPINKPTNFWQDKTPKKSLLTAPTPIDWVTQAIKFNDTAFSYQQQLNEQWQQRQDFLNQAKQAYIQQRHDSLANNAKVLSDDLQSVQSSLQKAKNPLQLWQEFQTYYTDSTQRYMQTLDILRERGDIFIEHESAGCPPVLDYDYEVVQDAGEFERPCNYVLLKILPPDGMSIDDKKRPYIIIDPRAGHGGGIGGFKHDSQVGVALAGGHPVYFVAFKRKPEPTQTIADVCHAEAQFVQTVIECHPQADEPVIVGNCQGGWAILILAATHPEIKGPIVLNGSPVSAWSGQVGINPMRYSAGVGGGTWLTMLTSDMGNGVFDGAWLVNNFEKLNPSRNYVGKYYDLYKNPLPNKQRFLDFERWWGGYFLMNEAEIRWIVENIFVGNRLARNTAQLEAGTHIDLKTINAPIIIFASYGDNITPPPQAINWVMDTYSDEREIEICGQRIVYMIHEHVGHLGIFVSSSIANREHKGIATLLDSIEIMPPGLYELVIEDVQGQGKDLTFEVNLAPRTFADLQTIDDNRHDEDIFKAIHRLSKAQAQGYETFVRPFVKAMSNDITADYLRELHPLRLQRSLWSSKNPFALCVKNFTQTPINNQNQAIDNAKNQTKNPVINQATIQTVTKATNQPLSTKTDSKKQLEHMSGTNASATLPVKQPVLEDNLFMQLEKLWVDNLINGIDLWRDWQGFTQERLFFNIWGMPWLRNYGQAEKNRTLHKSDTLSQEAVVKHTLKKIKQGSLVEAVIRIMVLISKSPDGQVDDTAMAKIAKLLTQKPFSDLTEDTITQLIREQTIMVRFDEQKAIDTLPMLLNTAENKQHAQRLLESVIDKIEDLSPHTQAIMLRIKDKLAGHLV